MASNSKMKVYTNEVHVHKLCQAHDMTYEAVYKKYGHLIDGKGMVLSENLKLQR